MKKIKIWKLSSFFTVGLVTAISPILSVTACGDDTQSNSPIVTPPDPSPSDPSSPSGPTDPGKQPTDPTKPTDPGKQPTDPTGPADPTPPDPTDPSKGIPSDFYVITDGKLTGLTEKGAVLTELNIPNNVTSIDNLALENGTFTKITINDNVKTIGSYAFQKNTKLKTVIFGTNSQLTEIGEQAFNGVSALTKISLPDHLKTIGDACFQDCKSLTAINFGKNSQLNKIGNNAFINCSSLTGFVFPNNVTTVSENIFHGCTLLADVTLSKSMTVIPAYFLENCNALKSVKQLDNIKYIELNAFSGCHSLTNIDPLSSLISIGDFAFNQCSHLVNLPLPDTLISIGNGAFQSCNSLANIIIPKNVTHVGMNAFDYCPKLNTKTLRNQSRTLFAWWVQNHKYGNQTLSQMSAIDLKNEIKNDVGTSFTIIEADAFKNCTSLTNITLPDDLTTINDGAFGECTSLTNISIPKSVTSIGVNILNGCNNLKNITNHSEILFETWVQKHPNNQGKTLSQISDISWDDLKNSDNQPFKVINPLSFANCTSLVSVDMTDGMIGSYSGAITSIGYKAFSGCSQLQHVVIPNNVIEIGAEVFSECPKLNSLSSYSPVLFDWWVHNHKYENLLNKELVQYTDINLKDFYSDYGEFTKVADNAFSYIMFLKSIVLSNVTSVGASAFATDARLQEVHFDKCIKSIGKNAFIGCGAAKFWVPNQEVKDLLLKSTPSIPENQIVFGN